MRVLCVQQAKYKNNLRVFGGEPHQPVENEIYNVISSFQKFNYTWYILAEFPPHECYAAEMFIPTSDIDETEMTEEKAYTYCV